MPALFTVRIDICSTQLHLRAAVLVRNTSGRIGPRHAASRRIASQTPRVALLCVLACVSCTYYHRRNARERTISIIIINPPAQRDRKMHLARGRIGNGRMHEDNTLRIIIKGRGRKLCIYEITIYRYYNLHRKRILYVICVVKTIR